MAAITGAHGVRGAMRLKVMTDFPKERLEQAEKVWLKEKGKREPREVRLLRTAKVSGKRPGYLAFMEGITTPEEVYLIHDVGPLSRSSTPYGTHCRQDVPELIVICNQWE